MASLNANSTASGGSRSNTASAYRSAKSLSERSLAGQPADADPATIAAPISIAAGAPAARRAR